MRCRAASQHIFGERLFVPNIMLDAREIKEEEKSLMKPPIKR